MSSNLEREGQDITEMGMEEILRLYDLLPSRFKSLYDSAPEPPNPLEWLTVIDLYGEARSFTLIRDVIETKYPGWKFEKWQNTSRSRPSPRPRGGRTPRFFS